MKRLRALATNIICALAAGGLSASAESRRSRPRARWRGFRPLQRSSRQCEGGASARPRRQAVR
jgi:hypothetical protein